MPLRDSESTLFVNVAVDGLGDAGHHLFGVLLRAGVVLDKHRNRIAAAVGQRDAAAIVYGNYLAALVHIA